MLAQFRYATSIKNGVSNAVPVTVNAVPLKEKPVISLVYSMYVY